MPNPYRNQDEPGRAFVFDIRDYHRVPGEDGRIESSDDILDRSADSLLEAMSVSIRKRARQVADGSLESDLPAEEIERRADSMLMPESRREHAMRTRTMVADAMANLARD